MIQNSITDPNQLKAGQLAIYKHDRGVELGSTEKQLTLSGQSGTYTHSEWDLHPPTAAPKFNLV